MNSFGLLVDGCRFRDTIADGINLCVGMRGTIVTNCTARGTGDDCFAIWPAAYTIPAYAPDLNVITHCTGQTPFLANGGAIYGTDSNRIEDCVFQDVTSVRCAVKHHLSCFVQLHRHHRRPAVPSEPVWRHARRRARRAANLSAVSSYLGTQS